jgi:hypothetical protein
MWAGTAVVEYMYADDENLLFAYVLRAGVDHLIHCHRTTPQSIFPVNGKDKYRYHTSGRWYKHTYSDNEASENGSLGSPDSC